MLRFMKGLLSAGLVVGFVATAAGASPVKAEEGRDAVIKYVCSLFREGKWQLSLVVVNPGVKSEWSPVQYSDSLGECLNLAKLANNSLKAE